MKLPVSVPSELGEPAAEVWEFKCAPWAGTSLGVSRKQKWPGLPVPSSYFRMRPASAMAPVPAASHGLWGSLAVGDPALFALQVLLVVGGGDRDLPSEASPSTAPAHTHGCPSRGRDQQPRLEMCGWGSERHDLPYRHCCFPAFISLSSMKSPGCPSAECYGPWDHTGPGAWEEKAFLSISS